MSSGEQRPETDDYDLLTFGEVAARLSEVLAAETAELEWLRREAHPDQDRIRGVQQRIERLRASQQRYSEEQRSNSAFTRRYGSPTKSSADSPQWH
ncbi:hypothetical protein A5735_12940 [Mycolicibacter heraklionensis]|nr:hypothetical protein A5735_12940 [Mycolicibacter heraklionensis]